MTIEHSFQRALVLGNFRTTLEHNPMMPIRPQRKFDDEQESIFASLTNIINSLTEFRSSIRIEKSCRLTDDGFIFQTSTDRRFSLSEAIEFGLISIDDLNDER